MRVRSPVGDFPFQVRQIAVEDGHLTLRGRMGAWPTRIEVEPRDAIDLLQLVRLPLLVIGGIVGLGLLRRAKRRHDRLS